MNVFVFQVDRSMAEAEARGGNKEAGNGKVNGWGEAGKELSLQTRRAADAPAAGIEMVEVRM